jgi:hypothetical protein
MKAIYVLHHDDPPCTEKLFDGWCPKCEIIPDMQSTCLWPYCPKCMKPLVKMQCPECKEVFEKEKR